MAPLKESSILLSIPEIEKEFIMVRFQVLTAASMMFRAVFIPDDGGSTHL
jgi:hypothetical protein